MADSPLVHRTRCCGAVDQDRPGIGTLSRHLTPFSMRLLSGPDFMELIGQKVSKRFDGLKVACHYGCHLVRPSDAVNFDQPDPFMNINTPEDWEKILNRV